MPRVGAIFSRRPPSTRATCRRGIRFIFVRHVLVHLMQENRRYKEAMIEARQEITRLKKQLRDS